jgi:hypothetical protein
MVQAYPLSLTCGQHHLAHPRLHNSNLSLKSSLAVSAASLQRDLSFWLKSSSPSAGAEIGQYDAITAILYSSGGKEGFTQTNSPSHRYATGASLSFEGLRALRGN